MYTYFHSMNGIARWLTNAALCLVAALSTVPIGAIEPFVIKTEVATYEVWRFPHIYDSEMTPDKKHLVEVKGRELLVHRLDGKSLQTVGRLELDLYQNWKIVGNELIKAYGQGWKVYQIPSLELLREITSVTRIHNRFQGERGFTEYGPLPQPVGWYHHGVLWDDSATNIIAILRDITQTLPKPVADDPFASLDSSGRRTSIGERSLSNSRKRMYRLPMEITAHKRGVLLRGFDTIPLPMVEPTKGFTDPLKGMSERMSVIRAGYLDFTVLVQGRIREDDAMYHIFITEFDKEKHPPPDEFIYKQPAFKFDEPCDWKYAVLGREEFVECKVSVYPEIGDDGKLIFQKDGKHALQELQNMPSLEKALEYIDSYAGDAKADFVLANKREPKYVPVSFQVRAQYRDISFTHFAWAEMTREEVVFQFAPDLIPHHKATLENNQKLARAAELQNRERLQKEAKDGEAAVRENHKRILSEKFNKWITRAVSTGVFVVGMLALLGLVLLSRRD